MGDAEYVVYRFNGEWRSMAGYAPLRATRRETWNEHVKNYPEDEMFTLVAEGLTFNQAEQFVSLTKEA